MRFDYAIGNPPFNEGIEGTSDKQLYPDFMDAAYEVAEKAMFVTPGRFLFDAGNTSKKWNEKMLGDPHLKVVMYESVGTNVFPKADLKGGVVVTYRDASTEIGPIGTFFVFSELASIHAKVTSVSSCGVLCDIMILQNKFDLDALYADYPDCRNMISSDGRERRLVSSVFEKLPVFMVDKQAEDDIRIFGVTGSNNKREYRYISSKYIEDNGNLMSFKVIVPKSNGSGAVGEVLSTPLVGEPLVGYTQSFIGVGCFETESEAEACLKYVKTKFARAMLGILKVTQDNPPEKWKYVPLQDFTDKSDIDWTKTVHEIDLQLYAKYGLDDNEISFIEEKVRAME